jgi:predicted negative regulator of RcsB-dependent stress response
MRNIVEAVVQVILLVAGYLGYSYYANKKNEQVEKDKIKKIAEKYNNRPMSANYTDINKRIS